MSEASSESSSQLSESTASPYQKWCQTITQVEKENFMWIINNFSFCLRKLGSSKLYSSVFMARANTAWRLELCTYEEASVEYLLLSLQLLSCDGEEVYGTYKFSLLKANGSKAKTRQSRICKFVIKRADGHGCGWGWNKYIRKDFLLDPINGLLPGNKLTILCEIDFAPNSSSVNLSGQSKMTDDAQEASRLQDDLGVLTQTKKFSDVTLFCASGEEFQAHKFILAARSPVFAAMFEHEMKEKRQNRVNIPDFDRDVIEQLLHYVYTGKAPKLERMTQNLFAASDKYRLLGLKNMCEDSLILSLTIKNAAETLVLADLHCASRLKAETINFISGNVDEVLATSAWKDMRQSHLSLSAEVLQAMVTGPCAKRPKLDSSLS